MGHLTRQPTSNDPPSVPNNCWLNTDDIDDEISLLLGSDARRCTSCHRATSVEYLVQNKCPDCRPGENARAATRPVERINYGASSDDPGECE